MTRPAAGRLRDQVTILELARVRDGTGQKVAGYSNTTTISPDTWWCEILQGGGTESERSGSFVAESDFTVTLSYVAGLDTTYRLQTEDSDVLEIRSVTHDQRRTMTTCVCRRTTTG